MKPKSNKTWVYVLVGIVLSSSLIGMTVYVIVRGLSESGGAGPAVTQLCMERLSRLSKAQLLYAADHDDTLPVAETWVDATWRYVPKKDPKDKIKDPEEESESAFRCPAVSMRREGGYGYAFNSALGGKKISGIEDAERTPMVFDSESVLRNASGTFANSRSRGRHNHGKADNIASVSGRVWTESRP